MKRMRWRERKVKVVRCEHFNRLKHSRLHLWAPKSPQHDQSTGSPLNPDDPNIPNQVWTFKLNQSEVVLNKMISYIGVCYQIITTFHTQNANVHYIFTHDITNY